MSYWWIASCERSDSYHELAHLARFPMFAPYSVGRRARGIAPRWRVGFSNTALTYFGFLDMGSEQHLRLLLMGGFMSCQTCEKLFLSQDHL